MDMKAAIALVGILLVSCTASSTTAGASPSLRPSSSASTSPTPDVLPLSPVDFTCRLPVSVSTSEGGHQGGFITFPAGTLTMDPAGKDGIYFDRAFSKWLPVARSSVSLDGMLYAFGTQTAGGQPQLHIVSVVTGADTIYNLPGDMYNVMGGTYVIDFAGGRVYMGELSEGGLIALWVLDLASGKTSQRAGLENAWVVDGDVVWSTSFNSDDTNPLSFPPGFRANQVERLDLATGATSTWLYRPGTLVGVMGLDGVHHPVVGTLIDKDTAELALLIDQHTQRVIYRGSTGDWIGNIDFGGGGIISDSHGTWFGAGTLGLYLYTPGGVFEKVSDQQRVRPANGCV